tara:strand:- start:288 stop:1550 length:1263 start_codon:yes stop_codon:yes gene_type:complete
MVRKGLSYKGKYIHQEGPALLGIGTIKEGGGFRPENVRTYGGPYKPEHVLKPGDVYLALTSQDGLLIGSPAKVPEDFPGIGITTHHDAKIEWLTDDPQMRSFLYWVMHTHGFIRHCINFSTGTTVYATNPKDVERFEVPSELTENQILVSEILNMIEEYKHQIIETNNVLNSLIESIFHSWFIDFDPVVEISSNSNSTAIFEKKIGALFPDSLQDSELGRIPSGWKVRYISELYDTQRGFSYSRNHLCGSEEGTPMVNLASFIGGGGFKRSGLKHISAEYKKELLIRDNDVLIATVDLTPDLRVVGSPLIPPSNLKRNSIFSQDLLALRASQELDLGRGYLFQWIKARRGILQQWSSGTTVSRFPPKALNRFPILVPSKKILDEFNSRFENVQRQIENNNLTLTKLEAKKASLLGILLLG